MTDNQRPENDNRPEPRDAREGTETREPREGGDRRPQPGGSRFGGPQGQRDGGESGGSRFGSSQGPRDGGEGGGSRFGGSQGPREGGEGGGRRPFGAGGGRRPGGGGGGRFGSRRKVCQFCTDNIEHVDYKDIGRLRRHVGERGKIEPRRKLGTCAKHQRSVTVAIKRARYIGLLPFTNSAPRG